MDATVPAMSGHIRNPMKGCMQLILQLTIQDGMTRVENARRAGITELPAYVFPRR